MPRPLLDETQNGFKVTVFGITQKTKTQEQLLALLSKNPGMTRKDLANALGKSPNTIKGHIAKLKAEGRLKLIGSDRNGYWKVNKKTYSW